MSMTSRELFVKFAARVPLGALGLAWLLALAGCPLQRPTFETGSPGLVVMASSAAPLVDDAITLTALAPSGDVDPARAVWTTNDPSIVSLGSTSGASITAHAEKAGTARVSVVAGSFQGAVTITVLATIGGVELTGPKSFTRGEVVTYAATVTDLAGRIIPATPTWAASGSLAFERTGANTGPSIRVRAVGLGAGAITASAGGRSSQIVVNVAASRGQLVILAADGTPLPAMVASGDDLSLAAAYDGTKELAADARWAASGACTLVGGSGSTVSVHETAPGDCTVTANATGMQATATFAFITVTSLKITGDTGPLTIGETRTFTAVGLAGTAESDSVAVTWSTPDEQVLGLSATGTTVKVTAIGVGEARLVAKIVSGGNQSTAMVDLIVAPASIQISAPASHVLPGASTTLTATALGARGAAARFTSAASLTVSGADGFTSVGPGIPQGDGTVTFALTGAKTDSPKVTVSFGDVTSNPLSFTIAQISGVLVSGPQGPVRVGSAVELTAVPVDSKGTRVDAELTATWADPTGVYLFPADAKGLVVTAHAVKLGTAAIVATVTGVASTPFASPAQPASVNLAPFSPASIAVSGQATALVTILDADGAPIPGATLAQISLAADDGTKVSLDTGVVMGTGFLFTATGLAPTSAAGVNVTATWTDGMYPVDSGAVPLIVTQ
ncbi:MAG TPA: hypothetical protein VHK47_22765 [Polyangia bacterium]|jgi:hypothetical protein|nr:hypothetical protein [Polyangia bacterium]